MSGHVLPLRGSDAPWSGGPTSPSTTCVLAPNASAWTLDGTNSWLLCAPGSARAVVVDPGPPDAGHLERIRDAAEARDARISLVLLTHGHSDHSESARAFAGDLGVGVRALDPEHRLGEEGLVGGDVVDLGDWTLDVIAAPGHSADSVAFVLPHDGSMLTGDSVLGRGTALVMWPDGRLGDYLDSLRRLRDVADSAGVTRLLPGHGPMLEEPGRVIDGYLAHRIARLAEVRAVVESGVLDPVAIVESVYADMPRAVWPAAELTVRAQLAYLDERA